MNFSYTLLSILLLSTTLVYGGASHHFPVPARLHKKLNQYALYTNRRDELYITRYELTRNQIKEYNKRIQQENVVAQCCALAALVASAPPATLATYRHPSLPILPNPALLLSVVKKEPKKKYKQPHKSHYNYAYSRHNFNSNRHVKK